MRSVTTCEELSGSLPPQVTTSQTLRYTLAKPNPSHTHLHALLLQAVVYRWVQLELLCALDCFQPDDDVRHNLAIARCLQHHRTGQDTNNTGIRAQHSTAGAWQDSTGARRCVSSNPSTPNECMLHVAAAERCCSHQRRCI